MFNRLKLISSILFIGSCFTAKGSQVVVLDSDSQKLANTHQLLKVIRSDRSDRLELVKMLLNKPLNLNFEHPSSNFTPLRAAIATNQLDIAELLLEAGAVAHTGKEELSPLGTAAAYGHTPFISLLIKHEAQVNFIDASGCTPVAIAVEQRREECLRALLQSGGTTTSLFPDGHTLLGKAAGHNYGKIVTILLEHGADAALTDANDHVPFGIAAGFGHLNLLRVLRDKGADPRRTNPRGSTAAHMAAYHGRVKCLELLGEWAPEIINAQDYIGRTPFCWAVMQNKQDVIQYLLDKGVDLTVTFVNGESILCWVKREYAEVYKTVQKRQKKSAPQPKKVKKKRKQGDKKTYNQRKQDPSVTDHKNIPHTISEPAKEEALLDPAARAQELNNALVSTSDGSCVLSDDGKTITFGYKDLQRIPTDSIYCLRKNIAALGPKNLYHGRVLEKRTQFLQGARDADTILHTQPEALERMHGHCIIGKFIDKKGRAIVNKLFLGKKLLNNEWVEGAYILGFARIAGEIMCYHSFFKRKAFADIVRDLEIGKEDQALFEAVLVDIDN